jgi:hypothetical protein
VTDVHFPIQERRAPVRLDFEIKQQSRRAPVRLDFKERRAKDEIPEGK